MEFEVGNKIVYLGYNYCLVVMKRCESCREVLIRLNRNELFYGLDKKFWLLKKMDVRKMFNFVYN